MENDDRLELIRRLLANFDKKFPDDRINNHERVISLMMMLHTDEIENLFADLVFKTSKGHLRKPTGWLISRANELASKMPLEHDTPSGAALSVPHGKG